VRTKLRFVGSIRRFAIYDLDYYFDEDYQGEDTVGLKSILVKTGPDEFHEIYVRDLADVFARIHPSEIVNAGQQRLLGSGYSDGGNAGGFTEVYFAFDRNGAIRMDFEPIYKAATAAVPKGRTVWRPASKFDFPSLKWQAWLNDSPEGRMGCCEGQVTITFRIDSAGRIAVTGSKYDPTADMFRR
jgi:hypothetical protein